MFTWFRVILLVTLVLVGTVQAAEVPKGALPDEGKDA